MMMMMTIIICDRFQEAVSTRKDCIFTRDDKEGANDDGYDSSIWYVWQKDGTLKSLLIPNSNNVSSDCETLRIARAS
jgi:hypothetical protein